MSQLLLDEQEMYVSALNERLIRLQITKLDLQKASRTSMDTIIEDEIEVVLGTVDRIMSSTQQQLAFAKNILRKLKREAGIES